MTDLKVAIVDFAMKYATRHDKLPSIRMICRKLAIHNSQFYDCFPKGIAQLGSACGLPPPTTINSTINATKARRSSNLKIKNETDADPAIEQLKIVLTKEQSDRIRAISHLENGKNESLIIDQLLNDDTAYRNKVQMNLENRKRVLDFLTAMGSAWNEGELSKSMAQLLDLEFQDVSIEDALALVEEAKELRKSGVPIPEYVRAITKQYRMNRIVDQYMAGKPLPLLVYEIRKIENEK